MERRSIVVGLVSLTLLGCVAWYLWIVAPKKAPWEESGSLVVAVRVLPGPVREDDRALGVNVDDVMLVRDTGDAVRATVLTRHVLLADTDDSVRVILETNVAVGSYAGVRLSLSSPEQRNAWTGDMAPAPITLVGEHMSLDIPFTVEKDTITALVLGFETNQAIHEHEGNNVYLPVIHTEARVGADVNTIAGDVVEVSGGSILGSKMFGMDWDASTYFNYRAQEGGVLKNSPVPLAPLISETPVEETASESATTSDETSTELEDTLVPSETNLP